MNMTPEDRARIAAAVAEAEASTAGEISCVLAPSVGDFRETPLFWAAGAALILPALALVLGFQPQVLADLFGSSWTAGHEAAAEATVFSALVAYVGSQAAIFVIVALIVSLPPVRRALTPAPRKAEQVHRAAMAQFQALGLANTRGRTGILIFAAAAEHRAEVIADEGIFSKAPQAVWDEVVGLLIEGLKRDKAGDGFVAAVRRAGQILAEHVPPDGDNPNETSDDLVILTKGKGK
jgi:putative membrane protein